MRRKYCKYYPNSHDSRPLLSKILLPLLALFLLPAAHAQTDYSGTYYIGSNGYNAGSPTTNYYLCPTESWYYYQSTTPFYTSTDNGQPFMTTYQCLNGVYDAKKAVWVITKHGDYYSIQHALDGKYLTHNGSMGSGNANRMRVHLEETADPTADDNFLFAITANGTAINIEAKAAPNTNKYLNVTDGNKNYLVANGKTDGPGSMAVGGIIGIWNDPAANSLWYLETAPSITAAPTITNNFDGTITITGTGTIYYTTDGTEPTTSSSTYSTAITLTDAITVIKAMAKDGSNYESRVVTYELPRCERPVITVSSGTVTITTGTGGASIRYTDDDTPPTPSSTLYGGPFSIGVASVIRAIAVKPGCVNSQEAIYLDYITVHNSSEITRMSGLYLLASDFTSSATIGTALEPFTGTIDGQMYTISGLSHPLVAYADGAIIKNVILDNVNINSGTNVGAICNEATGATRIYNCGVLGGSVGGSNDVGGIVGFLDGTARVVNCYNYANITGGDTVAGIVGYNKGTTTSSSITTMVMNCMFYGDITGSHISPVYGGTLIDNAGATGVNNYNYYRRNRYDRETDTYVDDVTFDNSLALADYHRSWPADAKYLTRFEYYRSILNSNKKLCTWWVNGTDGTAPTDGDVEAVGIAKWVLDPSIAPYPILKKWGKYPSVINQDPDKRFDPSTQTWVNRVDASAHWGEDMAPDTEGQKLGTVTVTINGGTHHAGTTHPSGSTSKTINITAMDTDNKDYCYGKIQLPYYNEIFGNPEGETWNEKYGGNYTAHVVTGWDISGGSAATDYNFADRNSYSGRVYAQGGYFYVPEGVTSITITAHWADAVYLCNKDYSIDRVNVAAGGKKGSETGVAEYGSPFAPAGTISTTFQGQAVYTTIKEAIGALSETSSGKDVYNQAIVLIGNVQIRNHSSVYGATGNNTRPFTLMSADLDFDNEPDNCLELQFRNDIDRPGVQPIRFDFLPVPELGLAIRTNKLSYAIGIMIPLGHFEITETAFMHTTQFEYDANVSRSGKSPVIINGGEHEMFTKRKQAGSSQRDRTSYFLLGGHAWVHRFAPGAHPNTGDKPDIYLFPVNVIGGQIKELYLTGLYRPELPITGTSVIGGAPRCYIDGGKFDIIAGAGYDKVKSGEDVTFKINHSLIGEFYGGGINASNPVSGNIDVTINNSRVDKYCGGPKVGVMAAGKTVTTHATGTTFGVFYGGGNGGNSYYRQLQRDGDKASSHIGTWTDDNYNWNGFSPLGVKDDGTDNKGYHAEYEFEVFTQSNGLTDEITQRGFIKWIQFGMTTTGDVESTLENCKVLGNFYGGGNLASVSGDVTSSLNNTQVNGSVFGAGYSAAIPTFQVHDKANKTFPSINDAGIITDGSIPYASTVYEWTNDLDGIEGHDAAYMKAHPTYSKVVNGETKWYCYTWNSLDNLGAVAGDVTLNISGASLVEGKIFDENGDVIAQTGGVYGGGDESEVTGTDKTVAVNITTTSADHATQYLNNVFGGGNKGHVSSNVEVSIGASGSPYVLHDVYGGGALADANTDASNHTYVTLNGGTVAGDVYGGGLGQTSPSSVEASVNGSVQVNVEGGTVTGSVYGCNNINGAPQSTVEVNITGGTIANVFGGGNQAAYSGVSEVNISGGAISASVYGGGNQASVGGGDVTLAGGSVLEGIYGGCNSSGTVTGNIEVNIKGGTLGVLGTPLTSGIFGGGYGEATRTNGNVTVNIGTEDLTKSPTIYSDIYGGSALGQVNDDAADLTTVNFYNGTLHGNVYGGGLGQAGAGNVTKGQVNGTVNVNIGTAAQTGGNDVVLDGMVFGCNNTNGSPQGDVNVDVYHTGHTANTNDFAALMAMAEGTDTIADLRAVAALVETPATEATGNAMFALQAVYGGGNEADYVPAENKKSTVTIHGCTENTIKYVYGGGRAASSHETHVVIEGGHIYRAFAGGDGSNGVVGANVGYMPDGTTPCSSGTGNTELVIHGGAVYQAFGGSNMLGKIRGATSVDLIKTCSQMNIVEVFGGNNRAASTGDRTVTINCGTEWNDVYGGSNEADITGNVTLNILGGKMRRVFGGSKNADINGNVTVNVYGGSIGDLYGGNNVGGDITGIITVNVDIDPDYTCADGLSLTNVYGGGKDAPYTPTDCFQFSPVVNIMNNRYQPAEGDSLFARIENVYGGGYGTTAKTVSYPRVIVGGFPDRSASITRGARVYNTVYGGGYGAPVHGNTTTLVRGSSVIGRDDETSGMVFGGGYGTTAIIHGDTYVGVFGISEVKQNVYGGGNAGAVLGNTDVQIGYIEQVLPVEIHAVKEGETVYATLVCATPGVNIRYTKNGTDPTTESGTEYSTRFAFTWGDVIKAIAYKEGMMPSVVSFDLSPEPTIEIEGSTVTLNAYVGARIYYTKDGTDPTTSSSLYGTVGEADGTPFTITTGEVVKAMAVMRGCIDSKVGYLQAEPPTITFVGDDCTITSPAGTRIIYTTDGSNPSSTMGGGTARGIPAGTNSVTINNVSNGTTIKAIVEHDGYMPSNIRAVKYTATP